MKIGTLVSKVAIVSGVILSAAIVSRPAMAASFQVTIEDPGVMNAKLSLLKDAYVQNFDGQALGFNKDGFTWVANGQTIGQYSNVLIMNADQYGGANGTGKYFDVDKAKSGKAKQTFSTLKLTTPQKYFGFWWSAGDSNNVLNFLSKGEVVYTMTTKNVVDIIGKLSNKQAYYGNPNSQFKGQDGNEAFAFINFYNTDGTFDEIKYTNLGGTGFETDNHTIAADYTHAVPESSAVLGIASIAFMGAASVMTRTTKKKTILELS